MKKTLIIFSLVASLTAGSAVAAERQLLSGWPYRASQNTNSAGTGETNYATAVCLSTDQDNPELPATAFACCGHEGISYTWSQMTSVECANNPHATHPDQQGAHCTAATATTTSPDGLGDSCLFS